MLGGRVTEDPGDTLREGLPDVLEALYEGALAIASVTNDYKVTLL